MWHSTLSHFFKSLLPDQHLHIVKNVCVCLYMVLVQHSWYSDSLRAGRSGARIPVGARFSAPVQTGFGAHPASCTMGTGSFQGVKQPGHGIDHPTPLVLRLKKEYSYTFTPPLGLHGLF